MSVVGQPAEPHRRRVAGIELVLVLGTAAVFAVLPKPPDATAPIAVFIVTAMICWTGYGVWRVGTDRSLLDRWGLRPSAHLRELASVLVPLLAALTALGAAWATHRGVALVAPMLLASMVLYPLWGLVQQWWVQVLFVDNVRELTGARLPWLMAAGAVGFGIVHVQHPLLVAATAAMGAAYVALFQRWRNLWPLAVCHGWLGSLFYPWVLGLDPLADIVALLLSEG